MQPDSAPISSNKDEGSVLGDNNSSQSDLKSQAPKKNYLFMFLGLLFALILVSGGYFLAKTTNLLRQNDPQVPTSKECSYDGKIYKPGESVPSKDGCNSCSCSEDGQVSCTAMACENSGSQNTIAPTVQLSSASVFSSVTPIPSKTYIDEEFGYQVSYNPTSWMFRHTYGKGGISNSDTSGTPRIISGFDLHKPSNMNASAIIVLNVLEAKNETDIDEWIKKYDLNIPENASTQMILNENFRAREYTYKYDTSDRFARKSRYFINEDKVFRVYYSEVGELSQETTQIVETLKP